MTGSGGLVAPPVGFGVQCRRPPGSSRVDVSVCVGKGGVRCRVNRVPSGGRPASNNGDTGTGKYIIKLNLFSIKSNMICFTSNL